MVWAQGVSGPVRRGSSVFGAGAAAGPAASRKCSCVPTHRAELLGKLRAEFLLVAVGIDRRGHVPLAEFLQRRDLERVAPAQVDAPSEK